MVMLYWSGDTVFLTFEIPNNTTSQWIECLLPSLLSVWGRDPSVWICCSWNHGYSWPAEITPWVFTPPMREMISPIMNRGFSHNIKKDGV
jgi:hypothetical protein